ncbi:AMP-binding protein [Actinotalea sp. M2MS4P-6]|uniref:AMP-binding protein n=1 Tax=Actinotalea sp. M2MS4P-6 TaxID=2983762 RepID=UPI0021E4399E|nr:AMP-binding protein [Actinotalea sp. M2MS4P-6]MCV2396494.1 AMP-binding protein [Actinotalea sp. M2MS4P-6]
MRPLLPWPVSGRPVGALAQEVAAALDGSGPALAPHGGTPLPPLPAHVPDEVAAVVHTSGSTGVPRGVLLDTAALRASAEATHERLGGPGRWLLALPAQHVAGLQVLVRSVLAGHEPAVADPGDIVAIATAAAGARYASVVPAQLHRAVSAADDAGGLDRAGLGPLAGLDAVLVGGAASSPDLLDRARDLGLRVVTTYGSTETAGGCVYDGVPLTGVEIELDDGVVLLSGPTLARGYLDGDAGFEVRDGRRWLRTADLGRLVDGRLQVLGRRDDVLVVGGTNVVPSSVERVLVTLPEIAEACVVGVTSERWGVAPVAVVVAGRGAPDLERARDAVVRTLGSAAAPRRLVVVAALPLRGPGKVDRVAVAHLAAQDPAD